MLLVLDFLLKHMNISTRHKINKQVPFAHINQLIIPIMLA